MAASTRFLEPLVVLRFAGTGKRPHESWASFFQRTSRALSLYTSRTRPENPSEKESSNAFIKESLRPSRPVRRQRN
jgi:hypothetical protein